MEPTGPWIAPLVTTDAAIMAEIVGLWRPHADLPVLRTVPDGKVLGYEMTPRTIFARWLSDDMASPTDARDA